MTGDAVRAALIEGAMQCWIVCGAAEGAMVTSVGTVRGGDTLALWIVYAAGTIAGGPKQRRAIMGAIAAHFETLARERGCTEVRVEARPQWRRVLAGYTHTDSLFRKDL